MSHLFFMFWKLSWRQGYDGAFLKNPRISSRTHHRFLILSVFFQHPDCHLLLKQPHLLLKQPFSHKISWGFYVIIYHNGLEWRIICLCLVEMSFSWYVITLLHFLNLLRLFLSLSNHALVYWSSAQTIHVLLLNYCQ